MNPIVSEWLTRPEGLATRLRILREQAGMSGRQFAAASGWHPTRVTKLERGNQMPSVDDLRVWVDVTEATGQLDDLIGVLAEARSQQVSFQHRMRHGQEAVQRDHTRMVRQASLIRAVEVAYVPGMLQLPEYTQVVLAEMVELHGLTTDDVDKAALERQQRQEFLYDRAKRFEFILTEGVLRFRGPDVMVPQLDRLAQASRLPNVRLGVIPFGLDLATTPQNRFDAYDELVVVETYDGERALEGDDAAFHLRVFGRLWDDAAEGDDARALIVRAADALR